MFSGLFGGNSSKNGSNGRGSENGKSNGQQLSSEFMSFLSTIASFSGDLASMTCPSFLLSGMSLLEYSAFWVDHPELFAAITESDSESERMLAAARWFISTLRGSYTTEGRAATRGESEKKPFNPPLGEQFFATWPAVGDLGETRLMAEQVSHHPPVSAFWGINEKAGVELVGHSGQKTRFRAPYVYVDQAGHVVITLKKRNSEQYLVTLPHLFIKNLLTGSPYTEVCDTNWIVSSTGWTARFSYSTRNLFSGTNHSFKCTVSNPAGKPTHEIEGTWASVSEVVDLATNEKKLFLDAAKPGPSQMQLKPLEEQGPMESHRLWHKVSEALRNKNYSLATREKTLIEEEQRAARRKRAETGEIWEPKYFKNVPEDEPFKKLVEKLSTGDRPLDYGQGRWLLKEEPATANGH
ncbi:uncharacterized protein VTP21DRAFT_9750 [Calcarisporiella thermophila]|uniref:uncharacterized protein n=1 Tax=Calcarisporiella thermophila TaxID=911321 RepID=UPI0037433FB7